MNAFGPLLLQLTNAPHYSLNDRYTYGKPVLGSVKAVVCRRSYHYWYRSELVKDICVTTELQASDMQQDIVGVLCVIINASYMSQLIIDIWEYHQMH